MGWKYWNNSGLQPRPNFSFTCKQAGTVISSWDSLSLYPKNRNTELQILPWGVLSQGFWNRAFLLQMKSIPFILHYQFSVETSSCCNFPNKCPLEDGKVCFSSGFSCHKKDPESRGLRLAVGPETAIPYIVSKVFHAALAFHVSSETALSMYAK